MSNNLCNEEGKKSVRMNDDDVSMAEELGYADTSASTVFTELLEDALKLKEIQDAKRREHRETRQQMQEEKELFGIS